MADSFEDLMGGPFGDGFRRSGAFSQPPKKKVQKGVAWAAKIINGQYYVPLAQVSELLKNNDVLPAVRKGIDIRVEDQKLKKEMGMD